MEIVLLLTKPDIIVRKNGEHYEVATGKGFTLNFSPEAMDELITDVAALKEAKQKTTCSQQY